MSVVDLGFLSLGQLSQLQKGGRENLLFGQFSPENCVKMKEIGPK